MILGAFHVYFSFWVGLGFELVMSMVCSHLDSYVNMCMYLVPHVYLWECECTKVRIGSLHSGFNGLSEDFIYKLTNIWPHLMHSLFEKEKERKS